MVVTIDQIKELRDRTGISIAQCKKALTEAGGDTAKALAILQLAGADIAQKKSARNLAAGVVRAYVHSDGRLGTLVALQCETDFVAKTADFKQLAEDLAMQIAATNPADKAALMAEPFIKDGTLTIDQLIKNHVQKLGERVELIKFERLAL